MCTLSLRKISVASRRCWFSKILIHVRSTSRQVSKREGDALLRIENKQRQVQDDSKPVSVDDEQEGQESVNGGFGDDVGVETVAEINGVDVVTVEGKKEEECQPTSSVRHNHSNVPGRNSIYLFSPQHTTNCRSKSQPEPHSTQTNGRERYLTIPNRCT